MLALLSAPLALLAALVVIVIVVAVRGDLAFLREVEHEAHHRNVEVVELNGEMRKFFTNSEEMKNILQQIREMPDGFPFETTIKSERFGVNKTKYIFT